MRRWAWLLLLTLSVPASAGEAKKPRLNLRASPRVAFTPTSVFTTAELVGEPSEDYYCPALEWDWGDGSRSSHQADCVPFAESTEFERRYTAEHVYRRPGQYDIRLTLRRASRPIAVASVSVAVRSSFGNP